MSFIDYIKNAILNIKSVKDDPNYSCRYCGPKRKDVFEPPRSQLYDHGKFYLDYTPVPCKTCW